MREGWLVLFIALHQGVVAGAVGFDAVELRMVPDSPAPRLNARAAAKTGRTIRMDCPILKSGFDMLMQSWARA